MIRFFGQYLPSRVLLLLVSETLLILATLQVAVVSTLNGSRTNIAFGPEVILNQLLITVICQICLYYSDLYNPKFFSNLKTLFLHLLQALAVCSLLVGAIYVLFPPHYLKPRFF